MPSSKLSVDVKRVRQDAVLHARREFTKARTTAQKHYARLALQKALRAAGGM